MDHSSAALEFQSEVESLLAADVSTPDAALEALIQVQRLQAHLAAVTTDLLITAADPVPQVERFTVESADGTERRTPRTIVIEDAVREEIAAALHWSPTQAGHEIHRARTLHSDLPETLAALRAGRISSRHATVIAETAGQFSTRHASGVDVPGSSAAVAHREACLALQSRLLPIAGRTTVPATRAAAKRALARIDADGAAARRRRQRGTRDVRLIEEGDGITSLFARLATPAAHAIMDAIRRHMDSQRAAMPTHHGDVPDEHLAEGRKTAGEKRAEALAALVLGEAVSCVNLDIVVPDLTDLESASLAGEHVALTDLADLLADPSTTVTLRRLLTDPVTGTLTGVGRTRYRLPARLREFLTFRDGTCRFPGCRRAAVACQIDHAAPWSRGGASDPCNLGPLCVRHHLLKTHTGWQILDSAADGSCTWRSPAGRRYRREAHRVAEPITAPPDHPACDRIIVEYVHGPGPHAPPEPLAA